MLPEDLFKEDFIEPETITQLFPGMSELEKEKLQVMSVLKTTRAAYEDMNVFENVCLVLNDISPDVDKVEGCLPEHIWTVTKFIKILYPDIQLSDEVKAYIKFIFNDAGYYFYPTGIGIANPLLEDIKTLAMHGPFPLSETLHGIQAAKYLHITNNLETI
jgi:hypothetical protein